jgi:DNA polymerase-3 subunit delta
MDIKSFFRLINDTKKDFPTLILLYGEEDYLIHKGIKDIMDRFLDSLTKELNYTELNGKDHNLSDIIASSDTLPFMAEKRIVIAREFVEGKGDGGEDYFMNWLDNKPSSTILIISQRGKVDKRKKLYKGLNTKGVAVECSSVSQEDLKKWLEGRILKGGKRIEREALNLLSESITGGLWQGIQEVDKLITAIGMEQTVTYKTVKDLVPTPLTEDTFDMVNAVSQGNNGEGLRLFYELLKSGLNSIGILAALTWQYRLLYYCKILYPKGYSVKDIAEIFGTSPYPVQKTLKLINNFSTIRVINNLELCITTDYEIKRGNVKDVLAMELLITKLAK